MTEVSGTKFTIRLTEDMKKWLFAESDRTGMTVSNLIRDAVESMKANRSETHGGIVHEQTAVSGDTPRGSCNC